MIEFKIGQIVEYNGEEPRTLNAEAGDRAIVYSLKDLPKYIHLKWIGHAGKIQGSGGYYPTGFKVVGYITKKELKTLLKNKQITNLEYLYALDELKNNNFKYASEKLSESIKDRLE